MNPREIINLKQRLTKQLLYDEEGKIKNEPDEGEAVGRGLRATVTMSGGSSGGGETGNGIK
ncbi:hypothetical protein A2U01_0106988, partial [Trifolium medium]|nr:hypothetical protein [Trifolium medium]